MSWLQLSLSLFLCCLIAGCGAKEPKTAPAKGTVKFKGQAVEGATVTFTRDSGNIALGEVAIGQTDKDGNFELFSHFGSKSGASGAVPGEYKVRISKMVPPPGMSAQQYKKMVDFADKVGSEGGTITPEQQPPPQVEMFPAKYSSPTASTLSRTVKDSEMNEFPFDLE